MRLLEIKIKNIASLKGEHHVSFRDIMAASPLFAITGETGSGKSSILNSIGLALYGNIFKKSVQQNDVVTLGEKEGQIELLFQARDKTYLATWRARVRKQNGELYATPQSPNRDLYEVNGDSFDSPKQITDKKVDDILHLDFDQFCKCVILNQGEFARFLSSSFSERKDILEKLYPGEVLDGLSGELHREREATRSEKDKLDVEINTLQGTGQSGDELREKKNSLSKVLSDNEKIFGLIEGLESHYKTMYHYFKENNKNQQKLNSTKNDITELTKLQNENLIALKQSQEAYESAKLKQDQELPRLQELLQLEEKERGLRESIKLQETKITKLSDNVKALDKKTTELKLKESKLSKELEEIEKGLEWPAATLRPVIKDIEAIVEAFQEAKILQESHSFSREKLDKLEEAGKEKAQDLQVLLTKKDNIPKDVEQSLKVAQEKKEKLSLERENQVKNQTLSQEITKTLSLLESEGKEFSKRLIAQTSAIENLMKEITPLRTTKKLSGLLHAVSLCRNHETTVETGHCPVCESSISEQKWKELRGAIDENEINDQIMRLEGLEKELLKGEHELKALNEAILLNVQLRDLKQEELNKLKASLETKIPSENEIDKEIQSLTQNKWELDQLNSEIKKLQDTLQKSREEFAKARSELQLKASQLTKTDEEIKSLKERIPFLSEITISQDLIQRLKITLNKLKEHREKETELHRSEQEHRHSLSSLEQMKIEKESIEVELKANLDSADKFRSELREILGDQKASEKIQKITSIVKELDEEFKKKDQSYRKLDLTFKETSGRLTQLSELLKEIELQFLKAKSDIRQSSPLNIETDRASLLRLLKALNQLDLDLNGPEELYIPIKELITSEKEHFKTEVTTQREALAATVALLTEWEKRQDKLTLLSLKDKDLSDKLARLERLYEVLGKDELRTFVLSLVEENLIAQTNEELQRLCQGRYEIVHQSRKMKITPEFYVLDKFREGGLRKVGTLSGGETFMVSLAMALALAEMTRGQAEIDSLFIDEGFGTLDQDSLEDVLEMLNQIQTRGLMVGIISHIKPLTNALPVNLLLSKRQDGTSSVSIQHN